MENRDLSQVRFDREAAGKTTKRRRISVDRRQVILFSEAIGETDPVCLDRRAARAVGYADVVAPPTFAAVIDMAAMHDAARDGEPDYHNLIHADLRILLHGEERYQFHAPIVAGDEVEHQSRVLGFADAKGGQIELAHIETTIRHAERGDLVTCRRTLIHRFDTAVSS